MTTQQVEGTNATYEDRFYVEHLGMDGKHYGPFSTPADVRAALEIAQDLGPGAAWNMVRERTIREPWPEFGEKKTVVGDGGPW